MQSGMNSSNIERLDSQHNKICDSICFAMLLSSLPWNDFSMKVSSEEKIGSHKHKNVLTANTIKAEWYYLLVVLIIFVRFHCHACTEFLINFWLSFRFECDLKRVNDFQLFCRVGFHDQVRDFVMFHLRSNLHDDHDDRRGGQRHKRLELGWFQQRQHREQRGTRTTENENIS